MRNSSASIKMHQVIQIHAKLYALASHDFVHFKCRNILQFNKYISSLISLDNIYTGVPKRKLFSFYLLKLSLDSALDESRAEANSIFLCDT